MMYIFSQKSCCLFAALCDLTDTSFVTYFTEKFEVAPLQKIFFRKDGNPTWLVLVKGKESTYTLVVTFSEIVAFGNADVCCCSTKLFDNIYPIIITSTVSSFSLSLHRYQTNLNPKTEPLLCFINTATFVPPATYIKWNRNSLAWVIFKHTTTTTQEKAASI